MPAIAQPVPIPSPCAGINSRDGVAALKPSEARSLVNWDPDGSVCRPRKGFVSDSAGGASSYAVHTLAAYNGSTGSLRIGVNGGKIWNFSSAAAIQLYDGMYADSRFQTECYNNYLFGVNGTDVPWAFNGTTVGATGFLGSGLTLSNLINVRKVRNRLWFCEKNSADVWYGDIGAITGALTKFQLSQIGSGGYLMAVGAHSQDAGDGPDDYTVFVMSTGEIIVYAGDPSTTFSKVGNYFMPSPVGRQCLVNIGGALAVITTIGLVPVQSAVTGVAFDVFALGNYGKVGPSLKDDVNSYGTLAGWHAVYHEGKVILNVPITSAASKQWVFNALTGAWTTWTGFSAASLCVQGSDLYFGSWTNGVTYKRSGYLDAGALISLSSRGAFISNPSGRRMRASAIRFDMLVEGSITGRYGLDANNVTSDISGLPIVGIASSTASTPWGSPWGSDWSTSTQYSEDWLSVDGDGQQLAVAFDATANVTTLQWPSVHLLIKQIGIR